MTSNNDEPLNVIYSSGFIPTSRLADVLNKCGGTVEFKVIKAKTGAPTSTLSYALFYKVPCGAYYDVVRGNTNFIRTFTSADRVLRMAYELAQEVAPEFAHVELTALEEEYVIQPGQLADEFESKATPDDYRELVAFTREVSGVVAGG